jgi:hypothetical protein
LANHTHQPATTLVTRNGIRTDLAKADGWFLRSTSPADSTHLVTAFRQGLKAVGFVEGRNVAIDYRWAEGQNDRLSALVADLIRRPVAVIVGELLSSLVAKATTTTVPIVFANLGKRLIRLSSQ